MLTRPGHRAGAAAGIDRGLAWFLDVAGGRVSAPNADPAIPAVVEGDEDVRAVRAVDLCLRPLQVGRKPDDQGEEEQERRAAQPYSHTAQQTTATRAPTIFERAKAECTARRDSQAPSAELLNAPRMAANAAHQVLV